jgi:hypothetical protein
MKREEQPVVVLLGGEESRSLVADALDEQALRLEWLREPGTLGASGQPEPAAVLVDRDLLSGPADVTDWIEGGRLRPGIPLLLVVRRRPEPADLQDWLRAGVWDLVHVPLDARLLGLRLRNLMGHRRQPLPGRTGIAPVRPYSWAGLVRATDETLALARRFDRPISCVAIAVHGDPADPPDDDARLLHRLGVATQEWVRGSDLVGTSDSGVVLVVLPDTPLEEARLLTTRLVATLERRLRRWSILARLEAHSSSPRPDHSASDFLLQAARSAV